MSAIDTTPAPSPRITPPSSQHLAPRAVQLRRFLSLMLVHAVLIAGAIFMLLPLVFMIVSAMKPPSEIFEATFSLWPRNFYLVQNFQTAQILGAARGAAMAAAALQECEIFEYAPLRVKQAVVGAGRASKEQMARTVMSMLGHGRTLAFDEADAAGVALCHALTWRA